MDAVPQTWRQNVKRAAPALIHGVRLGRWAANQVRFPVAAALVELRSGGRIMGGPFAGTRSPYGRLGGYQELFGLYEEPLIPVVERIIARKPSLIVDAGAAYGYYAIGLAVRCPDAKVVAYEMDRTRSDLMARYARLNGVAERVEVRGLCTEADLRADLAGAPDAVLIMDVEGAEEHLLDPAGVPALAGVEILLELHEIAAPGITALVRQRFAATHDQVLIADREPEADPAVLGPLAPVPFFRETLRRMMRHERDPGQAWLHLAPKAAP